MGCDLGMLEKCNDSAHSAPTFILAKKGQVQSAKFRTFAGLMQISNKNRFLSQKYPNSSKRLTYATALDLNMGYYTIRLDKEAQNLSTIIFPWGKYRYKRLPMGINCAPDIFQEKMSNLMTALGNRIGKICQTVESE